MFVCETTMFNLLAVFLIIIAKINFTSPQDAPETCPFGLLGVTTDLQPNDCYEPVIADITKYYTVENCLPICKKLPAVIVNFICANDPCVPGTICVLSGKVKKCAYDMDSCAKYYFPKGSYANSVWKPSCAPGGVFAPKQCKGERATGRCFCYDNKGKRIFGHEWWRDADDMNCGCSRKKAELRNSENPPVFTSLHCSSNGNYEALQCDVLSKQCFCVDEITGELTSPVVPDAVVTKLPCYESIIKFGSGYLRQCESKLYAQAVIMNTFKVHGTTASFGNYVCDEDGAYGPYITANGQAYCTWRDGSKIETFQGDASTPGLINCNCARDFKIFSLAGQSLSLSCNINGNYYQFQQAEGVRFCVDKDGFRKSTDNNTVTQEMDCFGIYEQGDAGTQT